MGLVVENSFTSLQITLTFLRLVGLWSPDGLFGWWKWLYRCLTIAAFMLVVGVFIIIQMVDLCSIWGDIQLMTATAFVLFTNITHTTKIINFLVRASRIKAIVDNNCRVLRSEDSAVGRKLVKSCNNESFHLYVGYWFITTITGILWSMSSLLEADQKLLPMRAWYPFDTTRSPAYQLAFAHQSTALYLSAMMNISKDTVVITLIAQCRCRLLLLSQALRSLCDDTHVTHFQTGKPVRMLSMACYLLNMLCQVFIYCYEGNELSVESENISRAAYEFPWYTSSVDTRRSVLIMMTRCCRIAKLTAAGFTTLSLASFMSICKASYSFFTVLKQVEEENY
ncbi:odorant receptor 94b-like [Leptidea sinapis]|uniref:odorant receptor 94b-like n=1 Tax=Leptidea sinapis TaxID=189913 RepID=UPI0021C40D09|nr:odorant receptor 94b-like [Leptidea sinapis]